MYVFETLEMSSERSPIARVFLNRKYFTGIFKTKIKRIWSGDIVVAGIRIYIDFVFEKSGELKIYRLLKRDSQSENQQKRVNKKNRFKTGAEKR